jgi:2,3-bisphosphoglycerate-independent phosphoglycerate mutase
MDVGLPPGQMGNSEVGHLNLGAGRIVYQDLTRINKAIEDGTLAANPVFAEALAKGEILAPAFHRPGFRRRRAQPSGPAHRDGETRQAGRGDDIMIHAITDGRDTSPTGGEGYLAKVEDEAAKCGARIATVIGRYFAMDRDKRWDRVKLAWDAIVLGKGEVRDILASEAVADFYRLDKTDEFMPAMVFAEADTQRVRDGDVVCFSTSAPTAPASFPTPSSRRIFPASSAPWPEASITSRSPSMTRPTTARRFSRRRSWKMVLGETVAAAGLNQMRIAETEKYPHVTYFFNGGVEQANKGEDRVIIPSPKDVPTYDFKPEMSAPQVTETVVSKLKDYDLVILNFANPDMVGHTGVVEAAIKAVETIDAGVKAVVEETLRLGGKLLITADHGNCEYMRNADGSPNTAHTTNLVHVIYVAEDAMSRSSRSRTASWPMSRRPCSTCFGLAKPAQMTGLTLVQPSSAPLPWHGRRVRPPSWCICW